VHRCNDGPHQTKSAAAAEAVAMATAASRDVSASRASFNDEQKRIANARVHAARTDDDEQRVVSCGGVFFK